jgi:hypothetical protein
MHDTSDPTCMNLLRSERFDEQLRRIFYRMRRRDLYPHRGRVGGQSGKPSMP